MPHPLDTLFHALADPTRRAILARLMTGPAAVSDLARRVDIAMPTLITHLGRLEAAGLVHTSKRGRVRTCRANPAALGPARRWIADCHHDWHDRMTAGIRKPEVAAEAHEA